MGILEQRDVVAKFRQGTYNLLVCTAVAREGIDIRACSTVILFDPPLTLQHYIQSRGRARHRNSEVGSSF